MITYTVNLATITSGCSLSKDDEDYILDDGESQYPCNQCDPLEMPMCDKCLGS
jgi:hypothetical protein